MNASSLSSAALLPGFGRQPRVCDDLLTPGAVLFKKLQAEFHESPLLIYSEKLKDTGSTGAFYSSNELDYFKAPIIKTHADLVVGFGTNSAFDVAIRTGAKELVLADWDFGPLLGLEYFVRPLALIAKSPNDFISLLTGIALPDRELSLSDAFNYLLRERHNKNRHFDFALRVLQRLQQEPSISADQMNAIMSYYADITVKADCDGYNSMGPFRGAYCDKSYDYFDLYGRRYHPDFLKYVGADPAIVDDPFFSFLNSTEAFARFKYLMNGHVHYLESNLFSKNLNPAIAKFMSKRNLTSVAFSLSNVIYTAGDSGSFEALHTRMMLYTAFLSKFGPSTQVFETMGAMTTDHHYYHYDLKSTESVMSAIQSMIEAELQNGSIY